MRRKKKNESIWHYLGAGLEESIMPRIKFWYEIIPGFAFKAVWLGKQRKWLGQKQYLVLYRDIINSKCEVEWTSISNLSRRDVSYEKFYNTGLLSSKPVHNAFINPNTEI